MMNLAIYSAQVLLVVAAATVSLALFRLAMPRARLTYWRVVVLICLLLPGLPGRRLYRGYSDLKPVLDGLGIAILSTSKGVMSDRQARAQRLGGELLCTVW